MFHAVLGSGSCGNGYVFYDGKDAVLIDDGFSLAELKRRLVQFDVPLDAVRCVFLTHFHPDHHRGLGVFARKLGLPVYMNREGVEGERTKFAKLGLPEETVRLTEPSVPVAVGNFCLSSFKTSHDSKGSVGYFISRGSEHVTLITDTGTTSSEMAGYAYASDMLYLEANYDPQMLQEGAYPAFLKQRISGKWGHLSNTQAFQFIKDSGFHGNAVFFIHLSRNNNTVDLVNAGAQSCNFPFFTFACPRGEAVNPAEVLHG
ncbi:MAG: MBL fold metallo-hydrolase [Spirochaetia bacterium]|jgi:phosphoribosyl 1,2-cyclic phosphodiesterase|nr:MBL fold metallo-hydrolase [Spirochaetia bacterium]